MLGIQRIEEENDQLKIAFRNSMNSAWLIGLLLAKK